MQQNLLRVCKLQHRKRKNQFLKINHTSRSYVCDGYCIFCNQNLNLDKTIKSDHKRDGKEHYRFDLKFWHFAEDTSDCYMIHLKALNENKYGIHWTLKHSNYGNVISSLKCVLCNKFTNRITKWFYMEQWQKMCKNQKMCGRIHTKRRIYQTPISDIQNTYQTRYAWRMKLLKV